LAVPCNSVSPNSVSLSFPRRSESSSLCRVTHGLVKSVVGNGCALLPLPLPGDIMFAILHHAVNQVQVGVLIPGCLWFKVFLDDCKQWWFCSACSRCWINFPFFLLPCVCAAVASNCKKSFLF